MRIGAILSAGGSPFFKAVEMSVNNKIISHKDVLVITDRECEAYHTSKQSSILTHKLDYDDKEEFSYKAFTMSKEFGCDIIIMLYSRYVSDCIYKNLPVINIHPSILPAFPGLGAIKKAFSYGAKFIGASAHLTTGEIDRGVLISQVTTPIQIGHTYEDLKRISYIQKTYLILCIIDLVKNNIVKFYPNNGGVTLTGNNIRFTASCNPALQTATLVSCMQDLQRSIGASYLIP